MNLKNISFEEDLRIIGIGDVFKTTTKLFHLGDLKFRAYYEKCICPVETIRKYINGTEAFRGNNKVNYYNHKTIQKASEDTLSIWVKNILQKAGIDMNIFPFTLVEAHPQVWRKRCICVWIVLETGAWRSIKMFVKHYDKPIENFEFSNTILQSEK